MPLLLGWSKKISLPCITSFLLSLTIQQKMKKINLLVIFLCLGITSTFAQTESLPHWLTDAERVQFSEYLENQSNTNRTLTPPENPVRTMGEWEEVQSLLITWTGFPTILTEITRHAVNECTVMIVTQNPSSVENILTNAGVPLDNVVFLNEAYNSIWIRDYGPWTIYENDVDSLSISDWIYNRPRPDDDVIPTAVAEYYDLPIYEAISGEYELTHTGGNHLVDGMGTAFSSELIYDENPSLTEGEIDEIANAFLGVDQYIKLPVLPYDGIHHLDMHMRLIDEETIIFGEYPEGISDGPQIEDNIDYLISNFSTPFGNPYNIVRIPMPPENGSYPSQGGDYRTYTNSIFINKTILVPVYEEQYDTTALSIYKENLPGYNVVGINCNSIIQQLGALHCITKLVGTDDPLWIAHPRLRDTYNTTDNYQAIAKIKHASGIASATLHYKTNIADPYQAIPMTLDNLSEDMWSASIPAQAAETTVYYYIEAQANSGKQQVRPIVAPEGYFRFNVKALNSTPNGDFIVSTDQICSGSSIQFLDQSTELPSTWQWSFPGGVPATSTQQNPTIEYPLAGIYDVTLIVSNDVGSDTISTEAVVEVVEGVVPFEENFSTINTNWEIENPGNDNAEWFVESGIACHDFSLVLDNFNTNTDDQSDFLRIIYDLTDQNNLQLFFDVAYAPYSNDYFDGLKVNVITCNGEVTSVYSKFGIDLATASATTDAFYPATCEEWRKETIDMSAFDGQTITLEFENVGGYGNKVYLDNILLDETVSTSASLENNYTSLLISPNPASNNLTFSFSDKQTQQILLRVFDVLGRPIHKQQLQSKIGINNQNIDLSNISNGHYFIELRKEDGQLFSSGRFVRINK